MSLSSVNYLPDSVSFPKVANLIELLGYVKYKNEFKIENLMASYFWYDHQNYKSYVGVELYIYKENGVISVHTRSRAGRSYWDLEQQNKTIKYLKDYFKGSFSTDDGNNRYFIMDEKPPTKLQAGLFISRWIYNNALIKPKIYLDSRNLKGQIANSEPTGLDYLDQMNPRFFSNNLLIPYLVAIWEEYLKTSYIVLLKCTENRDRILKNARFSVNSLKDISAGKVSVEEALVEGFSFQRPRIIAENYKALDDKLDIFTVLNKPIRNRQLSLFDSIERIIDLRNTFVHEGGMDISITDKKLKTIINDFEVAVDRIYNRFGYYYKFKPSRDF
ncbi:HEPN domain-containing protein [Cohnella sp. GCM10027633]|uniref:HEPN domain-containing protein n=1 Tax=unclassified Cohnella TaxID=2636738 RepID=UPI00362FF349